MARRTDPTTSLWAEMDLKELFNMNLVSKHKYHAACFQKNSFLERCDDGFRVEFSVITEYCSQAVPVSDMDVPQPGIPSAPLVLSGTAVVQKLVAGNFNATLSPTRRSSQRAPAWNKKAADIMYLNIMQLCVEPSDKALVCSTLQSLLSALQRKAPRPSALVDDTRMHTVYDKNLGRKRGNRGGVAELSPVPRVTRSKPAEPPDLVNIFRSPLASTKALSPSSPRLKPDTATTISQSCNHFRIGLKNLLELANYVLASQELQLAVDLGHMEARSTLALMYLIGYPHMPKDTSAAFSLAKSGFEASCPHCTGILAVCYFQGFGVKKNQTLAEKYAHSSSNKDSYIGQYVLGWMNDHRDVECITFYRKSALQGFHSAQHRLGEIYQEGTGVAKNAQQALHFFGLAAQQGNRFSQCALAECYEGGLLVDRKNISEAVRLYTLSAEQGDGYSCFKLAKLFHHGATKFRRDLDLAEQWYMKAQVAGYVDDTDALILLRQNKNK
jgi:TPR repeat protein